MEIDFIDSLGREYKFIFYTTQVHLIVAEGNEECGFFAPFDRIQKGDLYWFSRDHKEATSFLQKALKNKAFI